MSLKCTSIHFLLGVWDSAYNHQRGVLPGCTTRWTRLSSTCRRHQSRMKSVRCRSCSLQTRFAKHTPMPRCCHSEVTIRNYTSHRGKPLPDIFVGHRTFTFTQRYRSCCIFTVDDADGQDFCPPFPCEYREESWDNGPGYDHCKSQGSHYQICHDPRTVFRRHIH